VWSKYRSELTAVAAFIYYFLFLTMLGATVVGLFNFSRPERVSQSSRPEVERNVTATKKEPRLFMVVPKTNTDRLQRKQPALLRPPPRKLTPRKASIANQGRASAATRAGIDHLSAAMMSCRPR
jgi:hypothetical protein